MMFASTSLAEHLVRGILGFTALVVIGMSLPSCAPTTRVTVNSRTFVREGGHLTFESASCTSMELGGSGSGRPPPAPMAGSDFQFTESEDGDVVLEQIFSDTELLASRRYDEAFLTSGKVDEFAVKTHAGKEYVLRYWGGSCTAPDSGIDGGSGG